MDQRNEGDEIILFAFSQIGCKLDDSVSISQLTAENIIKLVTRALFVISHGDIAISDVLPGNLAARHRICTDIAGKVKELGYLGDCGYNQLLYPSPAQSKSILNWLMQKLPRSEDVADVTMSLSDLFAKRISEALGHWKKCWIFNSCAYGQPLISVCAASSYPAKVVDLGYLSVYPFDNYRQLPEPSVLEFHQSLLLKEEKTTDFDDLSSESNIIETGLKVTTVLDLSEQTKNLVRSALGQFNESQFFGNDSFGQGLLIDKSLTTKSFSDLISFVESDDPGEGRYDTKSRFGHATVYGHESSVRIATSIASTTATASDNTDIVEDEDAAKRETLLTELRSSIDFENESYSSFLSKYAEVKTHIRQVENALVLQTAKCEEVENDILIRKKTLEMLPSAASNIEKLREICASGSSRLMDLSTQWESHRIPLIGKLRSITLHRIRTRNKYRILVDDMKKSKETMSSMVNDLKDKQAKALALSDDMKRLPRNLNRNLYTHRILDITASIGKQTKEIERVTNDIRNIQKTVNIASSSLQRADAVAEDIIYTAAHEQNKDSQMVESYRHLRALRASFDDLILLTNKTGALERQARQLETKIDQESVRVSSQNADRILNDLNEMTKVNAALIEDIKRLSK